jgi:hypothetical protein
MVHARWLAVGGPRSHHEESQRYSPPDRKDPFFMATTDDVFGLLKAVNEVTLKRIEDLINAVNTTTLGRVEREITDAATLLKAVNEVTLKRMEDLINTNAATLSRVEGEIKLIKKKVGA